MSEIDLLKLQNLANRIDEFKKRLESCEDDAERPALAAAIVMLREMRADLTVELRLDIDK